MITIYTNAKEINLTEEVTHVRFEAGYPYFWVRNDGENAVLISLSPNVSEGADGVISVPAGNADGTMHGYRQHDLYIKGSGKVMAMGTTSAHNPFKPAPKGGEISGAGWISLGEKYVKKI